MGLFLVTIAAVFGLLFSMPDIPQYFIASVFVLALVICTVRLIRKEKRLSDTHLLQAYIFSGFLLYEVLKKEIPFFYHVLMKIAGGFSVFIGILIGKPVSMGITYSGIDVVVLFLIAFAAVLISKRVSHKKCLIYMVAMAGIWGLYIALWTYLAESSLTLGLNLLEPITGPLDYRIVLFAMLFAFFMRIYGKLAKENTGIRLTKFVKLAPIILIVFSVSVAALAALSARLPARDEGRQIVFWDTGIDFSVPSYEKYGLDYAGMFGILPHYLNQNGYNCMVVSSLDEDLLRSTDVLVVFNPMYSPSESELAGIWRFVSDGGSVLAVGDHTGGEQVRLPLNAILEPSGISLNFDSAIPFKSLWAEDYRLGTSPVFSGVSGRQIQMVVGASLDAGYFAKPLVVGKEGFSDLGDIDNTADGYLGDMLFNRGERVGDLLLAAEAQYGKGKFMAFGDTTLFQNTIIPYSYPFVNNIFAYLSDTGRQHDFAWEDDGFFKASCVIDTSHSAVLSRNKSGDSADGLIACAMRAGFMPLLNQNENLCKLLESRDDIKLVIFMEPSAGFSEEELLALDRFMENGGNLLLCAGYNSPEASQRLAGHYGFSFEPMPIGRIAPDKNPDMAFWNACPILYESGIPGENGDVDSIMEI